MRVAIQARKWVQMRRAAQERIDKCKKDKLCCGCMEPIGDQRTVRGLHLATCYHAAQRAISQGLVTESELVAAGRMLPKAKSGRKPSNPITVEYAK